MRVHQSSSAQPRALVAAISLALAASGAHAATFQVTSNADAGPGTLRQAIVDANGQAGPHTLDFSAISSQIITLAGDLPDITEDMTLQGSEVTLSGDGSGCLVADSVRLAAERMTITGCSAYAGGGIYVDAGELDLSEVTIADNDAAYGGGIVALDSSVTIADSTISDNSAYGAGGGIYSEESELTITDSTISGNTGAFAGGLATYARQEPTSISGSTISGNQADSAAGGEIVSYSGNIAIRNTTISGNSAVYEVGGLFIDIYQAAEPVVLDGVTMTGNQAGYYVGGLAASAYAGTYPAGFEIRNSIIAGNSAPEGGADLAGGADGPGGPQAAGGSMQAAGADSADKPSRPWRQRIAERRDGSRWARAWSGSDGSPAGLEGKSGSVPAGVATSIAVNYTLLGSAPTSGDFTLDSTSTNLVGANPQLGPLAANGGPTWAHLPAAGGAGVDAIPSGQSGCGADFNIDQRGEPRPEVGGNACDAGSVELTGTVPPPAEPVSVPVNHPLALGLLGLGAGLLGLLGFGRFRQRS